MKPVYSLLITVVISLNSYGCFAQEINNTVPQNPDPVLKYVFYLHGGIVQAQGANAVSQYYGKYEYQAILEKLQSKGYYVISEVRPKNSTEPEYAEKVSTQIDQLIAKNIPPQNITILGASLGAYIAMHVSMLNEEDRLNYVLLGLCSDYAVKSFSKSRSELRGNFLSIYEKSDSRNSCEEIFAEYPGFKEIQLDMGNSHGFLYKPYDEWVVPMIEWIETN